MRVYGEVIFDILYLLFVITLGLIMITKSRSGSVRRLFGFAALILGLGDAFHLVPRMYYLITSGVTENNFFLGFGKLVTSLSMTVFYVLLFEVWKRFFNIKSHKLDITVYVLAAARAGLCLFPQNEWFAVESSLVWGIIRNIPFVAIGVVMIYLFYVKGRNDKHFRFMWAAILFSFAFYIPVVLFAGTAPLAGMLMIPKTLMYVWIAVMGYSVRIG